VAKLFGLGYPGGVRISRLGANGNPQAYNFPRPMMGSGDYNFSFAGLKTALVRFREEHKGQPYPLEDVCASFEQAVVDVLVAKTMAAAEALEARAVGAAGGVAANARLRAALAELDQAAFRFTQESRVGAGTRRAKGTAMFYRYRDSRGAICLMRWDYLEPERQVLVNDGETVAFYNAVDRQLVLMDPAAMQADPLYRVLAGGRLEQAFEVEGPLQRYDRSRREWLVGLFLRPRQASDSLQEAVLWLDADGMPASLALEDQMGGVTVLRFDAFDTHPFTGLGHDDIVARFRFEPPPGTEIVDQRGRP